MGCQRMKQIDFRYPLVHYISCRIHTTFGLCLQKWRLLNYFSSVASPQASFLVGDRSFTVLSTRDQQNPECFSGVIMRAIVGFLNFITLFLLRFHIFLAL